MRIVNSKQLLLAGTLFVIAVLVSIPLQNAQALSSNHSAYTEKYQVVCTHRDHSSREYKGVCYVPDRADKALELHLDIYPKHTGYASLERCD